MLARLRSRIVRDLYLGEWREVWFFPRSDGVGGWQGTRDIMFVGLNPSTGRFGSRADQFFYTQLKRHGFANAHITDLVKQRAQGTEVDGIKRDPAMMRRYRRYLLREISIVRPRLIVGMGGKAHEILKSWFPADRRIRRIPHYSPRIATARTRRRFAAEMARIQRESERSRGVPRRLPRHRDEVVSERRERRARSAGREQIEAEQAKAG